VIVPAANRRRVLNNNRNLITYGVILLVLVGTGLLTISWPIIADLLSGESASMGVTGPETVVIPLPVPINGQTEVALQSWQLFGILSFLIIGAVITAGIGITIINYLLSRFVTSTESDPEFQQELAALEQSEQQELKAKQAARPTHAIPDKTWDRWAKATTILVGLMFAGFFGLLVASQLFPDGSVVRGDTIVNATLIVALALMGMTLAFMLLRMRNRDVAAIEDNAATASIPWDFIVVLLTGLIIVGIGIALIAILNSAA
jgi:hypothetical protein